jgi:multicomponent Na+:H+ antiporter subunit B
VVLLFGLYVQFHGDYGPGGGFQAGAIFGAGLLTFGLITSPAELGRVVRVHWANAGMALGVLIYGGVGIASMLMGGNFLDYSALAEQQTTGQHIGILVIEFGVGMTVASTMVSLYFSLNRQQGTSL